MPRKRPTQRAIEPPFDVESYLASTGDARRVVLYRRGGVVFAQGDRAHARDRASEGIPADVIPANFRRAARFAWGALLDAASE